MGRRVHWLFVVSAGLLGACGAAIGGDGDEGGGGSDPDAANVLTVTDGAPGPADAAPPDATPPCVGGDDNVRDPDTGTCYHYFSATPVGWTAAESACVGLGGHLADIASAAESEIIGSIAPATLGMQDVWVGGTDSPTEAQWHWIDGTVYWNTGTAVGFVNWRGVEPNNSGGVENCMVIEGDNYLVDRGPTWDDRNCVNLYPYMCEVP